MKKPFVIWVTLVISALLGLVAAFGLLKILLQVPTWLGPNSAIAAWRVLLIVAVQAAATAFLAAIVFAAFARPRWGRVACAVFAVLLALMVVYEGFHPDPHPMFAISPGAEEAGAIAGQLAMGVLSCIYAYKMVIGTKVRAYFQSTESRQ